MEAYDIILILMYASYCVCASHCAHFCEIATFDEDIDLALSVVVFFRGRAKMFSKLWIGGGGYEISNSYPHPNGDTGVLKKVSLS